MHHELLKYLINYYDEVWKLFDGKLSFNNLHYFIFGCDAV